MTPMSEDVLAYLPPYTAELARARRQSLGTLLARSTQRFPDKLAVIHRETRKTYAELDSEVNRVAHALADRGVSAGQRVAIYSHNSYEFVVAYFALARLAAISVPVNFNFTADEVEYVLRDSGSTVVIAENALIKTVQKAIATGELDVPLLISVGHTDDAGWLDFAELTVHPDASDAEVEVGDDDPIQLLYTSGTTSAPKGAVMTNRNLIAQYVSDIVDGEYHRTDIELHALPLYHCAALHDFLTPDIYLGATSVIIDTPTPANILAMVQTEGVTKMFCPPTVWIGLLRSPEFDTHDLSSLRKGYYGAAIMPQAVLTELGERLPRVRLFNFYGQTELAPNATVLFPEEQLSKAGSAGRATLNVQTRLHDDNDNEVGPGAIGEIVHRTPHLMRGYWGKPEATADAFRNGWFHSGDLGVMDAEGYLTIVDRKKDIIITGGENVASREVEDAIYAHPSVAEVAVFGVRHPYWIEAVAAAVVLREGATLTTEELQAHTRERLAAFKAPKYLMLVPELPKNPSGKILKRQLRDEYSSLPETSGR